MTTTNYATQIVNNLEAKGYTKDMIIGYLEGTINGLKYLDSKQVEKYLKQASKDSEK
jgi:hypothetical protein